MRRRPALLLVAALLLSPLAPVGRAAAPVYQPVYQPVAAGPSPSPRVDGTENATYTVPTRWGPLALYVVHPTSHGKRLRAHAILTVSPYSALGRNGDADTWTKRGYARMYADVIGTGDSGGCYDYGGRREKESEYDLVQWISKQPWSLGRVGMTGGSYDGTTAMAAAVMRPPALATIVPVAAISRWYDYAFSSGRRYTYTDEELGPEGLSHATDEGVDTPLAFDFGLAVPPPTDVRDPGWAERVQKTMVFCDELTHLREGYSPTPDYTAFWKERDYAALAGKVTIPVYVQANWGDWNVKQETGLRFFDALTHSSVKRMWFGQRWRGHGGPGGDTGVTDWMDRWVAGVHNGIENRLQPVTSETADSTGTPGRTTWANRTAPQVFALTAGHALAATAGGAGSVDVALTGTETEEDMLASVSPGGHGTWAASVSAPLRKDLRIFGKATLRLRVTSGRTWLPLAVSLVDLGGGESTAQVAVTRGWLDTRYEAGLERQRPQGAGTRTDVVVLKPMDYTFRKGHRIALLISGDELDWVAPATSTDAPCATCQSFSISLGKGGSSLTLPVVYSSKT